MSHRIIHLPVSINFGQGVADIEDLGIAFGEPPAEGDLFREATLPEGWTTETDHHPMWYHVVDTHGRRRISIFYGPRKSLDRDAFMYVTSVYDYVTQCVRTGNEPVTDSIWATPQAIAQVARSRADKATALADQYRHSPDRGGIVAQHLAVHALYTKFAERYETSND